MMDRLAVRQRIEIDVSAEALPQDVLARACGEVAPAAESGMVAMRVRDHGAIDGPPRVQVEIAWRAIEPFGSCGDEFHNCVRMGFQSVRFKPLNSRRTDALANGIGTVEQKQTAGRGAPT